MVNFPTWILDSEPHIPALLDLFISTDASICSTIALPQLGNFNHVVVSVSIDFPSNSKGSAPFLCIAYLHGFTTACAAAIAHRNHFLCQHNISAESKVQTG